MKAKNRWLIAASGVGIHISIGSVYAYSVMTKPVATVLKLDDPSDVKVAFMTAVFCLGMSAAFLGRLVEKIGPKKSGMISACLYGAGIIGSGFAIQAESLNLFYLCYGLIGGVGLGIGYITPVSTMVKWFPDKRGLATGMAIMGFGFASMIFGPIMASLFIDHMNAAGEAVYTIESISRTFWILGSVYFTLIMLSALYICKPPEGWKPAHMEETNTSKPKKQVEDLAQVSANESLGTLRFYLIWFMMFINISCGIAIISSASPIIQELFPNVPATEAAAVVGLMGVFNGLGRFGWSTASDLLGRPLTFMAFFIIQIFAFYALPQMTSFLIFQVVLFLILTCYGGGFSVMPAFLGDLFGTKQLGAIHGMVLTAWAFAGLAGPKLLSYLQHTLVKTVDGASVPDYSQITLVFSGLFTVALILSIMMMLNIKKLRALKNQN